MLLGIPNKELYIQWRKHNSSLNKTEKVMSDKIDMQQLTDKS